MSIPKEKENDCKECFDLFDAEKKGLRKEQLGDIMRALGIKPLETEIIEMVKSVKLNEHGRINFQDFLPLYVKKFNDPYTEDELVESFRMFDRDNSGKISKKELEFVLKNFGEGLTDKEIEDFLHEADMNGDGEIDYQEFVKYILSQ